jgi:hypothetical protein
VVIYLWGVNALIYSLHRYRVERTRSRSSSSTVLKNRVWHGLAFNDICWVCFFFKKPNENVLKFHAVATGLKSNKHIFCLVASVYGTREKREELSARQRRKSSQFQGVKIPKGIRAPNSIPMPTSPQRKKKMHDAPLSRPEESQSDEVADIYFSQGVPEEALRLLPMISPGSQYLDTQLFSISMRRIAASRISRASWSFPAALSSSISGLVSSLPRPEALSFTMIG